MENKAANRIIQSVLTDLAIIVVFIILSSSSSAGWGEGKSDQIAFASYTDNFWQAFVINNDGSELKQITRSPVDKVHVSWSSAKNGLLCNTNLGELFIVDNDTGTEENLDIGMSGMTDAVLSKDGKKVLFSLGVLNSMTERNIWLVDIATKRRERLTGMKHFPKAPVFSYDEKQVVFVCRAGGRGTDIWVFDLKTKGRRQITVGQHYHYEPDCSVKNEIAFSSNRTGNYEIWVCNLKGTKVERITHSPGLDAQPTWSPDGDKMAFVSNRCGHAAIWVINRNGSNVRQLTPDHMTCRGPAWSK